MSVTKVFGFQKGIFWRKAGLFLLTAVVLLSIVSAPPIRAAATLELYGTFNAMGVIVDLDAGDDADMDAVATVTYRKSSTTAYLMGFPLTRVSATRFAGSLFWLEPGTSYDVRVSFSDPDGALDGTSVDATGATRAEVVIPTPNASYHTAPDGSGSACSAAAPCALTEALSQAQAGDEVVAHGGVYYEGDITPPRSGSVGAPIVIRGADGETPILDGADPATFTWTAQGDGIYHTTINVADTHLVVADGERLIPYQTMDDLRALTWTYAGFYVDGTSLYVHLEGNADPNAATMIISRHLQGIYLAQDYVYLLDLTFRHYGMGTGSPKVIYINGGSDNLVQGCIFEINDLGIGIKRDAQRNVIQDNEFYDTLFKWPWQTFYAGEAGLSSGGIRFYSSEPTARGTVIRRNTFHDMFDGFGACPSSTGDATNETDVYENIVYRMGDDGMETDGRCSNVRIWGNTFSDVLAGISLAPTYDGPVYAIRNLIHRTGAGDNDYTGIPFKFNYGDYSGVMYLFHNTVDAFYDESSVYGKNNNGMYIKAPGSWEMIYARNNIWSGTDYALNDYNETQPIDFDYDNLYTTRADELVYWGSGNDRHMRDLATFQALTGQELHGFNVVPGFSDAANADYALDEASALIDAGVVIPGINDNYAGDAPDIGAFEFTSPSVPDFSLTLTPPWRSIRAFEVATYTVDIQPIGGFSSTVQVQATNLYPGDLLVSIAPISGTPLLQATLTVTDLHTTGIFPGRWYTIPVTATGGMLSHTTNARLLLDGRKIYLPVVLRH